MPVSSSFVAQHGWQGLNAATLWLAVTLGGRQGRRSLFRPELAAVLDIWLSSQLARRVTGRSGWRGRCCTCVLYRAPRQQLARTRRSRSPHSRVETDIRVADWLAWVQAVRVTDRFHLTENTHKVAVQLADRWATAVEAQARRIRNPENLRVTVPDQWLQVVALHHVLAAAQMARKHAPSAAMKPRIDAAIKAFLGSIVIGRSPGMNQREAIVLARDAALAAGSGRAN